MPLVALNVECPECAVPFLAPHRSPSNAVQCPHCGGQHLLSRCREVDPDALAQRKISTIRTTQEENKEICDRSRHQQTKLLLGAGGLVAVLGLGTYAAISFGFERHIAENEEAIAEEVQKEAVEKLRYDEAFAVAKKTLAAPDWRTMIQSVRCRTRAQSQAEWLYERIAYRPVMLTGYQFPQDMHVGEDAFVRLFVSAEGIGPGFWIRLQNSGYGWQLDWEALGRYTREHWTAFLENRAGTVAEYRVHLQRSSIPDRHFYERGFTGDGDAFGVRIWALDADRQVHAIVDAKSGVWKMLSTGLRWDLGEGYIVRLRWPEHGTSEAGYEFVEITEVLQSGWHISDRLGVAAIGSN